MRALLFLLVFPLVCIGVRPAQAGPMASIGSVVSFTQAPDGRNYQIEGAFALRGGYRFRLADTYLEYSRYSRSESVGTFGVDRVHSEWILWGRHVFEIPWFIQPYAAGGLGLQFESVSTTFGSDSAKDDGTPELSGNLAFGIRKIIFQRLNLELEGRMGVSRTNAPNPLLGVGFLVGWNF